MTRIIPRDLIKHLEWVPGNELPDNQTPKPGQSRPDRREFGIDTLINNGREFEDNNLPKTLRESLEYATEEGVVASMPYHIAGKSQADKKNYLWKEWFTTLSEENVGLDVDGKFTEAGKPVVITLHGQGILTPDRIQQAYDEGLTEYGTAKFENEEFQNLLIGTLPNGGSIDIFNIEDVKKGDIPHPFGRYAIALDFETAKATDSGYHTKEDFMNNPLVMARVGTLDYLENYFEKAKHSSDHDVRNLHRFNQIDPTQPQGRLLYLYGSYYGLDGNDGLDYVGRFVGVAPEARSARK